MSGHVTDELPRLLTGEAARDEVVSAAAHLRGCPDCQQELVSAVVAHASLTSAHRFAPEVVTHDSTDVPGHGPRPGHEDGPAAGATAGDRADEGAGFDDGADDGKDEHSARSSTRLPDLTAVFARAREEANAAAAAPARRRRRLVAVAVAAVVVGGGATAVTLVHDANAPSTRTVALGSYHNGAPPDQIGKQLASITIDGSKLRIDAGGLPRLGSKSVYELWLTDSARQNMQPVGQLGTDNTAVLPVTPKVLEQYNDFEVSVQPTDQLKKYSGSSVVRGQYG